MGMVKGGKRKGLDIAGEAGRWEGMRLGE